MSAFHCKAADAESSLGVTEFPPQRLRGDCGLAPALPKATISVTTCGLSTSPPIPWLANGAGHPLRSASETDSTRPQVIHLKLSDPETKPPSRTRRSLVVTRRFVFLERASRPTWSRSPRALRAPFRSRSRSSSAPCSTSALHSTPQRRCGSTHPRQRSSTHPTAAIASSTVAVSSAIVHSRRRLRRRARDDRGAVLRSALRSDARASGVVRLTSSTRAGLPCRGAMLMSGTSRSVPPGRQGAANPHARERASGRPIHGPGIGRTPCVRRFPPASGHRPGQESTGGGSPCVSFLASAAAIRGGSSPCLSEIGARPRTASAARTIAT